MSESSLHECKNCGQPVGEKTKIVPVFINGDPKDGPEAWCPRCFVHIRAEREPERYRSGTFRAVYCHKCGQETLNTHDSYAMCGQCHCTAVNVLGPVPKAS